MFNDLIEPTEFQGLSYHDRYKLAQDRDVVLDVLVVTEPTSTIAGRSGIVGLLVEDRYEVYYEGWVNGAMQYEGRDERGKWEAGVYHAAGRMLTRYPTIAKASLPMADVEVIGKFHAATERTVVENEESLASWLA